MHPGFTAGLRIKVGGMIRLSRFRFCFGLVCVHNPNFKVQVLSLKLEETQEVLVVPGASMVSSLHYLNPVATLNLKFLI